MRWYAEMGVDEMVGASPSDMTQWAAEEKTALSAPAPAKKNGQAAIQTPPSKSGPPAADEAIQAAERAAAAATNFAELEAAVRDFEGCGLKSGARNTVFADGVAGAPLLVIGEAPGRDEDRIGRPFVGRAGALLDRMLAAIEVSRETNALISNVIYWRPPGNRTPTQTETMVCRPFVDQLIAITQPKAILLVGGAPLQALFGVTGIMRARGRWRELAAGGATIPALPTFHPAYLLRQPAQKRLAWQDLQNLRDRLFAS
ncbi:MAG: uracil-DNA glycosylase [Pseudomonadota bacterium]